MQCPRPATVPYRGAVPCGQCMACRINRQRQWAARILLESSVHEQSVFITLTYDEEHLPRDPVDFSLPSLHPPDTRNFLKRLRHRAGPFRYFLVGEYGDRTWRPHYHAVLFGLNEWYDARAVDDAWGAGHTSTAGLTRERALYVAHYTLKKLTSPYDSRLGGRVPEYARMSRRPGLGVPALPALATALDNYSGTKYIAETGDVTTEVRIGGKTLPLNYFMAQKLREEMGVPTKAHERHGDAPPQPTDDELAVNQRREAQRHRRARRIQNDGTHL